MQNKGPLRGSQSVPMYSRHIKKTLLKDQGILGSLIFFFLGRGEQNLINYEGSTQVMSSGCNQLNFLQCKSHL